MNYVHALIDRARNMVPRKTDYSLCKEIGLEQTHLIAIKKGRGFFGPKQRARLAEITKIPHEELTAMLEFEKAKSEEDREFWRSRLPRISAAIFIGIVGFAAYSGTPEALAALFIPVMPADTLYIMRSILDVGTLLALPLFLKFCASQAIKRYLLTAKA